MLTSMFFLWLILLQLNYFFFQLGWTEYFSYFRIALFEILPSAPPGLFSRLRWAGPWQLTVLCGPRANKWQPPPTTARDSDTHMLKHGWTRYDQPPMSERRDTQFCGLVDTQASFEWIIHVRRRVVATHRNIVWTQTVAPLPTLALY